MRTVPTLTMALLCLPMTGCVSLPYRNPPGRDVAEIIFHNEGPRAGTAEIFGKAAECQKRRVVEPIRQGDAASAKLPVDRPVSFSLGYRGDDSDRKQCRVYATFSPAPNTRYDAFIRPVQNGCRLDLLKSTDDGAGRPKKVDFQKRERRALPLTEYSRFCR